MKKNAKTKTQLLLEIDELRTRLEVSEEAFRTLQGGDKATLMDITERKRMEEELTRLASFPQLNPNPVVEVDLAGHVHYSNPAVEQLFPDLKKAGLHHAWLMDLEKISEALKTESRKTYVRELRVGDIWYEQTVYYVLEGKRLRIYSLDISEHKKAEEALRQSEQRERQRAAELAAMLDAVPAAVWIAHDPDCLHITGNPTSDELLRLPEGAESSLSAPAPVRPQHFKAVKDGREMALDELPVQQAARGVPVRDFEFSLAFTDGTVRHMLGNASPMLDELGQPRGSVAAFMDITKRKWAEEELRKSETKLRRSRDELEIRVQERTAELMNAVEELQDEISERKRIEEALIEQSRILEGFFTSMITPLVFLDKDFNFIRVNEAYAKACQRDVSEFPGHNHFEFYPSDAKKIFEQVVERKAPFQAIARPFTFPDHPEWGTTYWNWILTPLLDDKGEVEFLVFSLEDVSERKRAEEQFKAASLYARSLIEASLDPLVTISKDGKIMYVNKRTELVTGVSRERLIGTDFSDYFTKPEKAREGYKQVFQAGVVWDYPLAIRHTSGRITDVLYNATVYKNESGEVQGVFAAARDITELKRTQDALRATSLYTRSLIEASPDPLVTISREGKIMDVNRATEHATGIVREQLIGSDFSDYFTEPEKAREGYRHVFEMGSIRDYPLAIRDTSGRITHVLYNATTYRNEAGEIQGVFAAARDITKRKRAEEALRAAHQYNRSLIEASLDPLVTINPEGKVTDVNSATELVTGVSRDRLIGSDFSDYFTEPEKAREGYEQVFEAGSVRDYPLSIRHTSGRITDVLYHATPIGMRWGRYRVYLRLPETSRKGNEQRMH